jgi:hypothetical protein
MLLCQSETRQTLLFEKGTDFEVTQHTTDTTYMYTFAKPAHQWARAGASASDASSARASLSLPKRRVRC